MLHRNPTGPRVIFAVTLSDLGFARSLQWGARGFTVFLCTAIIYLRIYRYGGKIFSVSFHYPLTRKKTLRNAKFVCDILEKRTLIIT